MNYIKYDFINNEIADTYETKDISEINEALELLEGSGYSIYVELQKILNNNNEV